VGNGTKIMPGWRMSNCLARSGILLVAVALVAGMAACLHVSSAVTFADPNLEAAVREAVDIPEGPISHGDLEALTRLDAYDRNIKRLAGLEHCVGLTFLDLGRNQISDISPLVGLTSLTRLCLCDNQISDISPVASLSNLTFLDLGFNQISDISSVANLTSLTFLDLGFNQISDISSVADLTSLTDLHFTSNQISDISHLVGLTNLTSLQLAFNQISDISPLIDNAGLDEGGQVLLAENPLSPDSINTYIPLLEARGVDVIWGWLADQ
jgi:Leucine-rich repeat (LRR) protein